MGPLTLQPLLSAKPPAVHPTPGWEDGDECNDYEYDDDDVDWAAGPRVWGWETGCTGSRCHRLIGLVR